MMEKPGRKFIYYFLILGLAGGLLILPSFGLAGNYVIVLKDGRKIKADVYGFEGSKIRVHQGGSSYKIDRDKVAEIIKLNASSKVQERPGKKKAYNLGQDTLTTFESAYNSTLGIVSDRIELNWLEDVLLQTRGDPCESKSRPAGFAVKWEKSPSVSVFGSNRTALKAAESAVSEINRALAKTPMRLIWLGADDDTADIKIMFGFKSRFPKNKGADRNMPDGRCYLKGATRQQPSIRSAEIWIATDVNPAHGLSFLSKNQMRVSIEILRKQFWTKTVLHELGHAIGLSHSSILKDSTMYCGKLDDQRLGNSRTFLSRRDVKVINLLYLYLKPGSSRLGLKRMANDFWRTND